AALGTAVGIGAVLIWKQALYPRWQVPIQEGWRALQAARASGESLTTQPGWRGLLWLLALIPGALWYFQLSRKYAGLSTLITGLFVGAAAGLALKFQTLLILPQVGASIRPLNPASLPGGLSAASAWANILTCLNNALFIAILLTALLYFFFSFRTDRPGLRTPLRFARLAIMVCLGVMFGGTVLTRVAYLLHRLLALHEWARDYVMRPVFG
ncbi:MAG: hypothetical protein AB1716_22920, partial [Planctomycetota bacterium]